MPVVSSRSPSDMKSLANALNQAQEGTGEVKRVLCSATFCPRLPGLTKMISKLSKEGAFRKGLEVFHALPELGITYDTTITNAAISACDKGNQWQAALEIFQSMPDLGLAADAITYSSVISALAKGKQWAAALQVFEDMQAQGVEADVVTCCSLISALERGGQWQLAEQLFMQMCAASQHGGHPGPLQRLADKLDQQQPQVDSSQSPLSIRTFSGLSWTSNVDDFGASSGLRSARSNSGGSEFTTTPEHVSSPLLSIKTGVGAASSLGRTASWTGGALHGLDVASDPASVAGDPASLCLAGSPSATTALPPLTGPAERLLLGSPLATSRMSLSIASKSTDASELPSPTSQGSPDPMTRSPPESAPRTPDSKAAEAGRGLLPILNTSAAKELQASPFAAASRAFCSPQLPPIKMSQDPSVPKPGSPRKRVSTLRSIVEVAPTSEGGFPASPGTPASTDKINSPARQLMLAREKLDLDRHRNMPVTQQFSVNAITLGGRSSMDVVKAGSKAAAGAGSTAAAVSSGSPQLAIDGCPLPVCLERSQDASGNPDPSSPMVPRLKHMNVSRIAPNRVCCNALLAAFARARPAQWQKALTLLEAMTEAGGEVSPDVVSYNTCLKACGSAAKLDQGIQVYKGMVRQGVWPSITTFGTLLTAASHAGSYETVKQVWQWLLDSGLEVSSACIHAYVSALAKRGHWEEARLVLQQTLGRRSPAKQDPVMRQMAAMLPNASLPELALPTTTALQGVSPLPRGGPDSLLHQLAQLAIAAAPPDLPLLACEAMTAFQQSSAGSAAPGHAFASLLCVLGCGGLWDTAFCVYNLVHVKEVLDAATVSNLISGHAAAGQLFWALHYWLALRQQAASPSLQAQQALLCACRDRNAWQPALHILHAMLASQVAPDRVCYGAVMQSLVKAGLLQEAAQVLLLMPQKGLWPDALLMADVLSFVDAAAASAANSSLNSLLQVMSVCGLSEAKTLAEVARALNMTSLPHLCLHLLNCLPLAAPSCAETHWIFVGCLVLARQVAAAVQVTYHGHAVGALRHYKPYISALNQADSQQGEPLMTVDLTTCGMESALMVLLAWACSFSQALQQGAKFEVKEVILSVGAKALSREQQRGQVVSAARSILAPSGETGTHILLAHIRLPRHAALCASLAKIPDDGRLRLPLTDLAAWTAAMHPTVRALLAPL